MKLSDAMSRLQTGYAPGLILLYGSDASANERYLSLCDGFARRFGEEREVGFFSAPGRTEIGGNHTDHQRGRVLAAALHLDAVGVASQTEDAVVRLESSGRDIDRVDISDLAPQPEERTHSAALIRGICARMKELGFRAGGFDAYTHNLVLPGSGMSSSAAFEVLVVTILNHLYNDGAIPPITAAQIAQYAENVYFGKPSGLMDQAASALGGAVSLDFADPALPAVRRVDLDLAQYGYALCLVDTGGTHADLTEEYAAIPAEMRAVAAALGGEVLRETDEQEFLERLPALRESCGDRAALRALHFFSDDRRAALEADALERGDFDAFLRLMRESGFSSILCLQNIAPASDSAHQGVALGLAVCARILGERGAYRVHGGGFGGTVQAFVPADLLDAFRAETERVFGDGGCHALRIRPQGGVEVEV